ncbi:MAG: hypothetical protein K8R59_00190, partial [Thermoanaerobaculales bacterium]|nr:hypothetical protein [Thermoanaerobaculales bacterium]
VSRLRPVALVVSAGFAGHRDDPVSGLKMTEAGFSRMTRAIVQASEAWSDGRVLSILEGGYEPKSLAASARAHVEALAQGTVVN